MDDFSQTLENYGLSDFESFFSVNAGDIIQSGDDLLPNVPNEVVHLSDSDNESIPSPKYSPSSPKYSPSSPSPPTDDKLITVSTFSGKKYF